jgi:BirA family transcriptional regulator, biotin operon repressor / biotin---[acetyl-CoA-carboxylase] ligase
LYTAPLATLFLGKNLVFVPECHSTNSLALQLSQQTSTPEGTLVITENQTAGRGQRGNSWETEPGMNLTFTVVFRPGFLSVSDQFYLNIITSLAVQDYLKTQIAEAVLIKWPNDILVGGKKICGILIENQIQGNRFSGVVVGVGLNINQRNFAVDTATSLSLQTLRFYELQKELENLLHLLETRYLQLKGGKFGDLKRNYLNHLYRLNEPHAFVVDGNTLDGVITGIDEVGRLTVKTDYGVRAFGVKEIGYK